MKRFNVVIATAGRDALQKAVDSIAGQLSKDDFLTIIWDCDPREMEISTKAQVKHIHNPEPLGFWGHGSRNRWIPELPGDYFINGDDDDVWAPDAMKTIRKYCKEEKLYIFQFDYDGVKIPRKHVVKIGNIGTSCGVYPKVDPMPEWGPFYGGDGAFYEDLAKMLEPVFIDEVIYIVRPRETQPLTLPEKPKSIKCSHCQVDTFITENKMLICWEGYCSRCDRTTR